ncbi:392a656e-5ed7-4912-9479-14a5b549f138-CDS [Sclerotinia trifoliorum]|uniref:392a656e-5ed7-4912-9479-14a5b549f138-CDS n=1 Tax=Sclerotinia trifoliorum TaxID=28548 RepID=A0A8H2VW41_9HELO|nr:392a656e-5ed7-4912-9479-14a5b549f138-CDS [Sclerotinia trifoliorum]
MHRASLCCISESSKPKDSDAPDEAPRMTTHSTTKPQIRSSLNSNHQPLVEHINPGNFTKAPQIVIHLASPGSIIKDATPQPYHLRPFYHSQHRVSFAGKKFQDTLGSLPEEDEEAI